MNQQHIEGFIDAVSLLEARNNRTAPDYSAFFWARHEDGRQHVAVCQCAEYRHVDRIFERKQGKGRILCFIERATGNVVAPRNTRRVAPGHVVLGNIADTEGGLGKIRERLKVYSDEDHAYLRHRSLVCLNAGPGQLIEFDRKRPKL